MNLRKDHYRLPPSRRPRDAGRLARDRCLRCLPELRVSRHPPGGFPEAARRFQNGASKNPDPAVVVSHPSALSRSSGLPSSVSCRPSAGAGRFGGLNLCGGWRRRGGARPLSQGLDPEPDASALPPPSTCATLPRGPLLGPKDSTRGCAGRKGSRGALSGCHRAWPATRNLDPSAAAAASPWPSSARLRVPNSPLSSGGRRGVQCLRSCYRPSGRELGGAPGGLLSPFKPLCL